MPTFPCWHTGNNVLLFFHQRTNIGFPEMKGRETVGYNKQEYGRACGVSTSAEFVYLLSLIEDEDRSSALQVYVKVVIPLLNNIQLQVKVLHSASN